MTVSGSGIDENGKSNAQQTEISDKPPFISVRWTVVGLGFLVFFTQGFTRQSFSVSLVAMVSSNQSDSESSTSNDVCPAANTSNADGSDSSEEDIGEYDWNASQQGIILGAYFWGVLLSRFFGSRIGEMVGQRITLGAMTLLTSILVLLSPLAASIHPMALAAVRFLTGIGFGPIPSSVQSLLSAWAPREELSSMLTTIFSGQTLGGMLGLVVSGWLSDEFGWRVPFWLGGAIGLIVFPLWVILVRNTPHQHPRLSPYERKLLEVNRQFVTQKTVPWLKIVKSPYVNIIVISAFARLSVDTVLNSEGPSFMKYKIGLDISTAGFVCGGNSLCAMILSLVYGRISDMLITRKYLSKIHTRKLFHLIGAGATGIFFIGLALADCHSTVVIVLWIFTGGMTCATSCSFLVSMIDIAPNYAGTVMGYAAIGNLGSALTPIFVSAFLKQENGWNHVFYLISGMCLVSCTIYITFMTDEVQPWNSPKDGKNKSADEISKVDSVSTDNTRF